MYEVLTGESPFLRENFVQTVMAHINEEAMPIEQLVPQAVNPTKLHDIIHKCMRRNIGDRYPSMTEVIEDLSSIMRRGKERSQTMISTSTDSAERKSAQSGGNKLRARLLFEEKGDDAQALVYYMRAAERGHAVSQYFVGRAYYWGFGVEPDLDQATAWYRKAANGGVINAVLELFHCLVVKNTPEGDKEAYHCITSAANAGFAPAQYEFGRTFKEGLFCEPSMAEALNWFRKPLNRITHRHWWRWVSFMKTALWWQKIWGWQYNFIERLRTRTTDPEPSKFTNATCRKRLAAK